MELSKNCTADIGFESPSSFLENLKVPSKDAENMFYRKELVLKAEKMIQSWDIFAPKGNLFFVTHALKDYLSMRV
jgi:hypothetical protein